MQKIISITTLVLIALLGSTGAFVPSYKSSPVSIQSNAHSSRANTLQMSANGQNIVVISPPGGVGEVAAVQAAQMGSSVKWFVVSPPSQTSSSSVSLSSEAIQSIEGKGSLELAGASAETLLLPSDDPSSAIKAVSTWCSNANGIICTVDGIQEAVVNAARAPGTSAKQMEESELRKNNEIVSDAIKVAAKEACGTSSSIMKVAVIPAEMDTPKTNKNSADDDNSEEGSSGFLSSLFGGNTVDVPKTLSKAMSSNGMKQNFATLRYGELFGIPESSVSHFVFCTWNYVFNVYHSTSFAA